MIMNKTGEKARRRRSTRGVTHDARPDDAGAAHVVLELRGGLPSLRTPRMNRIVKRAIRRGQRDDFGILEFSILTNHLHLVVEADGKEPLSRGMQGLVIRLAKAFNRVWGRKGSVFPERYFARYVKEVNELRRVLRYVLQNARKHGIPVPVREPDPYSSAPWFPWDETRGRKSPEEPRSTRRGRGLEMQVAVLRGLSLLDLPGGRESCGGEVFG